MKKRRPAGIKILCYIYLINIIFYVLSLALFFNRLLVLNRQAGKGLDFLIKAALLGIPLYLFIRLQKFKKDAYFLAFVYHLFFFLNNISNLTEHLGWGSSLIRIVGSPGAQAYSSTQIIVIILSAVFNLGACSYLLRIRKKYFKLLRG